MKISFERRLILFFTVIFAGIIILGVVAFRTNRSRNETNKLIIHTKEVMAESELVLSLCKDIVMGSQRYVITGDSAFSGNSLTSGDAVFTHIKKLKELTKDNYMQQVRIDSLNFLMKNRIAFSEMYMRIRNQRGFEPASRVIASGRGKFYINEIRNLIAQIEDQENDLLVGREDENNQSIVNFNTAFYSLLITVFIVLGIVFFYILDNFKKRAKTEQEIREANNFLNTILENIPNMIFVKDADELRFVRFNKAGEELLGYSRKDLIGKNDYDFFPKEQADFFTGKDRDVIIKGELFDIPEEPINTATGERILHTKKIPITDEHGKPLYLLGISEDITEQKMAEQRLKDLNERFQKIFSLSPIAMSISGIDDARITQVNETFEKLFLMSKEEVIGKSFAELKIRNAEERNELMNDIQKEGGSIKGMEMKLRRANGEMLDALVSIEIITINDKKSLISAAMDITQRKQAEEQITHLNAELEKNLEQLQAVNKELEAFTYSVSHDLRSPLRIVDGYADILIQDYKGKLDEEGTRTLEIIKSSAQRMGRLIDDLLNLSRVARKELTLNKVIIDELVRSVIKDQQELMPSHPVEIKIQTLEPVKCDAGLIRQVWTNLISNAIKYSRHKEKAVIEIGSYEKEKEKEIIYFVKDNGVGFDMRYVNKLFGVFQRLHKITEFEGTGVGLAIVQRIILKHGGRVWAEAEVDKGATFYFSLPA